MQKTLIIGGDHRHDADGFHCQYSNIKSSVAGLVNEKTVYWVANLYLITPASLLTIIT